MFSFFFDWCFSIFSLDVDLAPHLHFPAANNVLLHLDKLQREGKVSAVKGQRHGTGNTHFHTNAHTHAPAAAATTGVEKLEPETDEDDCTAEVAKAHAIAKERAEWRWKLTE